MTAVRFSGRNTKEIVRDPLNLFFGLGFPLVLLLLLSAIQANVPVSIFEIEQLAPGMAVFGFSFIALFSATLISNDRASSFMTRLLASPLTASDFICGYALPLLPMALAQSAVCLAAATALGLRVGALELLVTLLTFIPAALLFIAIGLICGSLLTDKQVGGICGALLTNLSAWLSGTWFDLELVGGPFQTVAEALPFVHAVDAARAALSGDYGAIWPDLAWVLAYAGILSAVAVLIFRHKMYEK